MTSDLSHYSRSCKRDFADEVTTSECGSYGGCRFSTAGHYVEHTWRDSSLSGELTGEMERAHITPQPP